MVPTYMLLRFIYKLSTGRECQLLSHYIVTQGPDDPLSLETDCDPWSAAFATNFKPCVSETTRYQGVHLTFHSSGQTWHATSTNGQDTGTGGSDSVNPFDAVVIQKRTGAPNRTGIGRWFIGGCAEANTLAGRLTNAGEAAFQTLGNFLSSQLTGGGGIYDPAVYSKKLNELNQITHTPVDTILMRQSRRRLLSLL